MGLDESRKFKLYCWLGASGPDSMSCRGSPSPAPSLRQRDSACAPQAHPDEPSSALLKRGSLLGLGWGCVRFPARGLQSVLDFGLDQEDCA